MMDILSQMKTVDLMLKFLRGDMRKITPYPFVPQKKESFPESGFGNLPFSTPEEQGISSAYIRQFFEELDACVEIDVHSVLLLRHGKVIAEGNFQPYTDAYPHMVFSLSKSITGMAVGLAVEDGLLSLDEKVVDIFPEKGILLHSPKINAITVRHLLNMTSGIKFNEVGSVVETDWVRAFLLSDCSFEPGSEFYYNSMNSYMLSAIVCKKTGKSLMEYLEERLFHPLGIDGAVWETCPLGIEKGGWGLYLRIADMAKLGQLYLQKGRWSVNGEEKQLIAEDWIAESTKIQTPPSENGKQGYGYQIWNFDAQDAFQYNGVFGQYVIVLPAADMVVAITSGSQNLFYDRSLEIVEKYFGDNAAGLSDQPLPSNIKELRRLKNKLENLFLISDTAPKPAPKKDWKLLLDRFLRREKQEQLPPLAHGIDKKQYRMEKNFGSLMPLILQAVTNNFPNPILSVSFLFEPCECTLTVSDGVNENVILAGLDGIPRRTSITLNGETYVVGATARLTMDEDDRTVIKLYLSFLETPFTRIMKFVFYGEDKLLIRFTELPSVAIASQMLMGLVGGKGNSMNKMLMDTISQQRLADRVDAIMQPRAKGVRISDSDGKTAEIE